MKKHEWRERLTARIKADGRSPRDISLTAKLGPNYVSQEILSEKSKSGPGIEKVIKLCDTINVSFAYICSGVDMTPEVEEFLASWSQMSEENRTLVLGLIRNLQPNDEYIEEHDADHDEIIGKK